MSMTRLLGMPCMQQVARQKPEISDRNMIVLERYFGWWTDATEGLEELQSAIETRQAKAAYSKTLSTLEIQAREMDRLRAKAAAEATTDPVLRQIQEEEEEARILDVRADDVAHGL